MILRTERKCESFNWQAELKNAVTDIAELFTLLHLDPQQIDLAQHQAMAQFPLRVPRSFIQRMQKGNMNDPLLQQVLPLSDEMIAVPGYTEDALQETRVNPRPGLLHKYQARILIILTGGCVINCRFCFRRQFPYSQNIISEANWKNILDYMTQDNSIHEVIFSGGDPLLLQDEQLSELIEDIAKIPHIKTLRFHTRLPIVIPQRITEELISLLSATRLRIVLVVHSNHGNEIDDSVIDMLKLLRQAGITLLNQSVLLKNINDDADILIELSEKLFDAGILPYYLHVLDKVKGTAHFDVSEEVAKKLLWEMMQQLPGYLVPKLVKEVAGMGSKMPVV
jgi:L-lysine 2,3-aminomutase